MISSCLVSVNINHLLFSDLVMPFTSEELRSVDYMIEYYNLSKETYVFSEENDDLFKRLFQDTPTPEPSNSKYSYSQFDLGGLIMTLMKKNIFFCRSIDQGSSILINTSLEFLHNCQLFKLSLQHKSTKDWI